MVALIEGQREIGLHAWQGPLGDDAARAAVDHGYMRANTRLWDVDKNARAGLFQLERLGMPVEDRFTDARAELDVHDSERAVGVTDEQLICPGIEAQIVLVLVEVLCL